MQNFLFIFQIKFEKFRFYGPRSRDTRWKFNIGQFLSQENIDFFIIRVWVCVD